jgi:hypothetical protein
MSTKPFIIERAELRGTSRPPRHEVDRAAEGKGELETARTTAR